MLVEERKYKAATVRIYDDAYINRTEEEIEESIKNLTRICSRIQYQKQLKIENNENPE